MLDLARGDDLIGSLGEQVITASEIEHACRRLGRGSKPAPTTRTTPPSRPILHLPGFGP
jgi:hypothetical protein